jgi:hypothetical protein
MNENKDPKFSSVLRAGWLGGGSSPPIPFDEEHRLTYTTCAPLATSDYLIGSENPLFSFLALFAALFSIKVLTGFFLFCFLLSLPLLMLTAPYAGV